MDEGKSHRSVKDVALQRILALLDRAVKANDFYGAHQAYKSLYFRFLRQDRYKEVLDLLLEGALLMFDNNQQRSGVDLANHYVEVLVISNTEPCEKNIKDLVRLLEYIKKDPADKDVFVNATVHWSSKSHKGGHPILHQNFAQVFWKEKNYSQAKAHFIYSEDGSGLAEMLIEVHRNRGYTNEVDLFIAQVVLQCLCVRNLNTAVKAFECYTSQHPSIHEGPPYILPLLNFIWFLLEAIRRRKVAYFMVLCVEYQVSIGRDPTYKQYLQKIGEIFFNIPVQVKRPNNILGNLFGFLTGVREGPRDSEVPSSASASSSQATTSTAPPVMDMDPLD